MPIVLASTALWGCYAVRDISINSFEGKESIGTFFEDQQAILNYLPCKNSRMHQNTQHGANYFICTAGQWHGVTLKLNPSKKDKTKTEGIKLFWRVYPKNSFFEDVNQTHVPFFDFITQRYGFDQKTELRTFLNKNTEDRIEYMHINGLTFRHHNLPINDMRNAFKQHSLLIYR